MSTIPFDPFAGRSGHPFPVFDNIADVVPSDTDDLPVVATALWIETARQEDETSPEYQLRQTRTIKLTTPGGQRTTMEFAGAGLFQLPVRIAKVWATGTTADKIWAFW